MMKFLTTTLFCLLTILECYQAKIEPLDIETFKMNNGLSVVFINIPESPLISIRIIIHAGGSDDVRPKTGLAHYLEHLTFLVNGFQQQQENFMQNDSVYINAQTSAETTVYIYGCFEKTKLSKILNMELLRFKNFKVNKKNASQALQTVLEEESMWLNNPIQLTSMQGTMLLFRGSKLGIPTLGYHTDLISLTLDDAKLFHKNFYTPDNMTIVIIGDINKEKTKLLLANSFGTLTGQKKQIGIDPLAHNISKEKNEERFYMQNSSSKIKNTILNITWKNGPTLNKHFSEFCTVDMICKILNGDFGILTERFVKTLKIASSVSIRNESISKNTNLTTVSMELMQNVEPEKAEEELLRLFKEIASRGIDEKKFNATRKSTMASLIYANEDMNTIIDIISEFAAQDVDPIKYNELEDTYDSVTIRYLNKIFRKYFSEKPHLITIIKKDQTL